MVANVDSERQGTTTTSVTMNLVCTGSTTRQITTVSVTTYIQTFLKFFWSGIFPCPILGPLVPLFWISGDISSGFQSQSGFCLIRIAEANVMYIPWDPPLVLHVANLLWALTGYKSCLRILLAPVIYTDIYRLTDLYRHSEFFRTSSCKLRGHFMGRKISKSSSNV